MKTVCAFCVALGIALLPNFFARTEVRHRSQLPGPLTKWKPERWRMFREYERQRQMSTALVSFVAPLSEGKVDIETFNNLVASAPIPAPSLNV